MQFIPKRLGVTSLQLYSCLEKGQYSISLFMNNIIVEFPDGMSVSSSVKKCFFCLFQDYNLNFDRDVVSRAPFVIIIMISFFSNLIPLGLL